MNRTLIAAMAVLGLALGTQAASAQLAKERTRPARQGDTPTWEIYAGWGYTSLNQIDQSRFGLQGVEVTATRDFGRYFGATADGSFYSTPLKTGNSGSNPGDPSVTRMLAGPEIHGALFERLSIFARGLVGTEHTGGESMKPSVAFAGGFGAGLDYKLGHRFWVRGSGDRILASSVSDPNNKGYSPHMHQNARASVGLVYKF